MTEMIPVTARSSNVASVGFDGKAHGSLWVQFKDKDGKLTSLGYYKDVPRSLFNAMQHDKAPGTFIFMHLKPYFDWTPSNAGYQFVEDPTLPPVVVIPASCPNTIEAIDACLDAQRIPPASLLP